MALVACSFSLYLLKRFLGSAFMLESMINSMTMTTSMQLAEGCLKQDDNDSLDEDSGHNTYEGAPASGFVVVHWNCC